MSSTKNDKDYITDYDEECHYYNIKRHKLFFVLMIVLAFIVCAFVFPWAIGVIVHSLVGWGKTENAAMVWFFSVGGNNILPDFMGGMVGLFTGFIVEWWLISKLHHISKYSSIVEPLYKQLGEIKKDAIRFIGYLNEQVKVKEKGKEVEKEMPNIEICREMFDYGRVEDLVKNLDNYSLLYNLPRRSPREKTAEDSKLANQLDELYIKLKEYESLHEPCELKCVGKDGNWNQSKLKCVLADGMGAEYDDKNRKELMTTYCKEIIKCANSIAHILKPKEEADKLGENNYGK